MPQIHGRKVRKNTQSAMKDIAIRPRHDIKPKLEIGQPYEAEVAAAVM